MQFVRKLLEKYIGNTVVFNGPRATAFFARNPKLEFLNNVTNLAPIMKWSLSIVPISQIISGTKPPQSIDLAQSSSLCATGTVWTYYATLISPQNNGTRLLAICNGAMAMCHGYNIYRKTTHDRSIKNPLHVTTAVATD